MTQTTQEHDPTQDVTTGRVADQTGAHNPNAAGLYPPVDSASDGDAGERPVREKLKKTSIASIAQPRVPVAGVEDGAQADTTMGTASADLPDPPETEPAADSTDNRGRPVAKRGLDDLDSPDFIRETHDEESATSLSRHARKRSRDVRSGEPVKPDGQRGSLESPLPEEGESDEVDMQNTALDPTVSKSSIEVDTPPSEPTIVDQEMQEPIRSPRKKRSRDSFEVETDREQKIAATDETRARRRSSEEQRQEASTSDQTTSVKNESIQNGHPIESASPPTGVTTKVYNITPSGSFANTSTVSPFGAILARKSPDAIFSSLDKSTASQETQTSASAFASSGFAALAKSSTSPFGSLQTTSAITGKTISPVSSASSTSTSGTTPVAGTEAPKPTSLGFGTAGPSPFAKAAGSTFGSGFGGGFGGGSKLSSFAAPAGESKLGTGKVKPFGAATTSDDEDSGSDDCEDGSENDGEEQEEEKIKFHEKHELDTGEEDEETIFQSRGKLFQFQNEKNSWAERGIGPFKLNVKRPDAEGEERSESNGKAQQARFIMRTAATHRVVLNAPVFKGMDVGDGRGKDPAGKQMVFSVPVNGRLVPHMLKMGKEEDIQRLFREVRRLQESM